MGSRSCWITLCDLSGPLEYLVLASRVYRHWRFGCFIVERKSIDGFGAQWVLLGMAVYGFWQWRYGGEQGSPLKIGSWPVSQHLVACCIIIVLSLSLGFWLDNSTSAAWPYVDSATTVSAVIATFMVAKKILENWLYWIAIDVVSVWIYWERELYMYAVLFVLYSVIAVFGFMIWQRQQAQEQFAIR